MAATTSGAWLHVMRIHSSAMAAAPSARVPRQPAERVPVGLREVVAGPVAIAAGVGHAGDAGVRLRFERAVDDARHRRAAAAREGVGVEELLPHRRQVGEVVRVSQILLGNLQFRHQRCLRHRPEQRMERLARLEVQRAVLHLHERVGAETPVERHELHVGALGAVRIDLGVVDKGAPHHDAAVRRQRVGQHVGAVGVRAAVVLRPRLALAVGLDHEPAEVRNARVDLVRLGAPPGGHRGSERIGGVERLEHARRGGIGRQVDANAVGTQRRGDGRDPAQVGCGEHAWIGVDVVDHGAVDAERGIGARVVDDPVVDVVRPRLVQRPPQRGAGVAAFDGAVEIVPVVQHAARDARPALDVERVDRPLPFAAAAGNGTCRRADRRRWPR